MDHYDIDDGRKRPRMILMKPDAEILLNSNHKPPLVVSGAIQCQNNFDTTEIPHIISLHSVNGEQYGEHSNYFHNGYQATRNHNLEIQHQTGENTNYLHLNGPVGALIKDNSHNTSTLIKDNSHNTLIKDNSYQVNNRSCIPAISHKYELKFKHNCENPINKSKVPPISLSLQVGGANAGAFLRDNADLLKEFKSKITNSQIQCKNTASDNIYYSLLKSNEHNMLEEQPVDSLVNSVFESNMNLVSETRSISPTLSIDDSTGANSGSSGEGGGLRELLLLPSSYTELSIFQKKYFPTNDYTENTHLNRRINNTCEKRIKKDKLDEDYKEIVSPTCNLTMSTNSNSDYHTTILSPQQPLQLTELTTSFSHNSMFENRKCFEKNKTSCEVCGYKAAGFYCGAFVCEACKKFYMRAAKIPEIKYRCVKDNECVITKESRIQCQSCRYQKCLSLKMFIPGENQVKTEASLIMCQVCGAPSSGYHFGALTCEGCKGFFRRMVKGRHPDCYVCSNQNCCPVTVSTRNSCKACRFQKCKSAGMSVTCSRIGRQPNAVRHAISLALRHHSSSTLPLIPTQIKPVTCDSHFNSNTSVVKASSNTTNTPISTNNITNTNVSDTYMKKSDLVSVSEPCHPVTCNPPMVSHNSTSPNNARSQIVWEFQKMDTITMINKIKMAAIELNPIMTTKNNRPKGFNEELFKDYKVAWKELMKMFDFHANCVIKFSKKIPDFRLFDIQTQVLMIQLSSYTIMLLHLSRGYNPETNKFNFLNFNDDEATAVIKFFPNLEPVKHHLDHIGTMVKSLKLDETEICLISALLLIDEENVKSGGEKEKVREMQEQLTECLKLYEEESYNKGDVRYGVILLRLSEFSLASLQYGQTLCGLATTYPDLEYPQLFTEMLVK